MRFLNVMYAVKALSLAGDKTPISLLPLLDQYTKCPSFSLYDKEYFYHVTSLINLFTSLNIVNCTYMQKMNMSETCIL